MQLRADQIEIEFSGLDIQYDGGMISTVGVDDPLSVVSFYIDGSLVGNQSVDLSADIAIPNVTNIPVAGGSVVSDPGGVFDLDFAGADFLDLDLGAATVIYQPTGNFSFVFAGSTAQIAGQSLPFGLQIGDPVSVSFSTVVTPGSRTDNGLYLTGFVANGAGEAIGGFVPEPSSVLLVMIGLLAASPAVRRRG
ncbi:PEP-CTERM sorting domain-containing protein [Pseudobythopirellula maris]|nr:PEP-CTERM sorting domain-containing protein [Pseudobythopirellula maris]